jgi:hypothetical protein
MKTKNSRHQEQVPGKNSTDNSTLPTVLNVVDTVGTETINEPNTMMKFTVLLILATLLVANVNSFAIHTPVLTAPASQVRDGKLRLFRSILNPHH